MCVRQEGIPRRGEGGIRCRKGQRQRMTAQRRNCPATCDAPSAIIQHPKKNNSEIYKDKNICKNRSNYYSITQSYQNPFPIHSRNRLNILIISTKNITIPANAVNFPPILRRSGDARCKQKIEKTDLESDDGRRLGEHAAGDPRLHQRARPPREVEGGGRPHPPRHRRQRRRLPPCQPRATARNRHRLHLPSRSLATSPAPHAQRHSRRLALRPLSSSFLTTTRVPRRRKNTRSHEKGREKGRQRLLEGRGGRGRRGGGDERRRRRRWRSRIAGRLPLWTGDRTNTTRLSATSSFSSSFFFFFTWCCDPWVSKIFYDLILTLEASKLLLCAYWSTPFYFSKNFCL